jgi:hypothetical protein
MQYPVRVIMQTIFSLAELRTISLIEEKMYKGTSKLVDYKSPFKITKIRPLPEEGNFQLGTKLT